MQIAASTMVGAKRPHRIPLPSVGEAGGGGMVQSAAAHGCREGGASNSGSCGSTEGSDAGAGSKSKGLGYLQPGCPLTSCPASKGNPKPKSRGQAPPFCQ